MNILWCIFYSAIFIAFGLGVVLTQLSENIPNGFWFIGFGFILSILAILQLRGIEKSN